MSKSSADLFKRDEFVRYIHFPHADDDEKHCVVGASKAIMKPHILYPAGIDPFISLEENIGEPDVIFHSKSLEYLEEMGPFLMKDNENTEKNCSMLLYIADNVKVLTPPDDPLLWDILNMAQWKASFCEEMRTVEEKGSSLLMCNTKDVYVLTTSQYDAFLRALAAEIANCINFR